MPVGVFPGFTSNAIWGAISGDINDQADLQAEFDTKVDNTWTVVGSAAASVSPAAADSGTYYRLSHATATLNLPTTGLVVGNTHFWVTFLGSSGTTIDAGTGKTIDSGYYDPDAAWAGSANQTATYMNAFTLFEIRYVATNIWASNIQTAAP